MTTAPDPLEAPESVARELVWQRFRGNFTDCPVFLADEVRTIDPSIQELLNTSGDTPAGPQPVSGWTPAKVIGGGAVVGVGYVQAIPEFFPAPRSGLMSGDVGGVMSGFDVLRFGFRFASVMPVSKTAADVEERFRKIRALYERSPLQDPDHAEWPSLVVRNRAPGLGSPWESIRYDIFDTVREGEGWRSDSIQGWFEVNPLVRPLASSTGAPIEITL